MPSRMTTLARHTKVPLLALLVLVATITRSYANDCGTDQMFLRGTFNAWSTASMSCGNGHWSTSGITFSDSSGGRYKFDVLGDWSENYGAGNGNRVAKSGPNIPISGPGTFKILFDYEGKTYEAIPEENARPCGTPRMQVRGTFNNWDVEPMQCMEDGTWFIAGLAFEEGGASNSMSGMTGLRIMATTRRRMVSSKPVANPSRFLPMPNTRFASTIPVANTASL